MDPKLIAPVLQGEAGIIGYAGFIAVATCLMSRVYLGYNNPIGGFYGWATPTVASMEVAQIVVTTTPEEWVSEWGIYPYCLSEQDRQKLDFPPGDIVVTKSGKYKIHMYRRWYDHYKRDSEYTKFAYRIYQRHRRNIPRSFTTYWTEDKGNKRIDFTGVLYHYGPGIQR